jgi:hypothetical protein
MQNFTQPTAQAFSDEAGTVADNPSVEEPTYFLIWIAVWIIALAVLLPALA